MSLIDNYNPNKFCFVDCGDKCNCQPNALSTYVRKFEDKYEVLNMYSYLNHPYYNSIVQYLSATNKIAIIFCKSDDEVFNIIKSEWIKVYKVFDSGAREKILKEYQTDFGAYDADYNALDTNYSVDFSNETLLHNIL